MEDKIINPWRNKNKEPIQDRPVHIYSDDGGGIYEVRNPLTNTKVPYKYYCYVEEVSSTISTGILYKLLDAKLEEEEYMNDIFDLENLDDVPEKLRPRNAGKKKSPISLAILELFEIKNILTSREICVALYRKFKMEISLSTVGTYLSGLAKSKTIIEKIPNKKGTYRKVK